MHNLTTDDLPLFALRGMRARLGDALRHHTGVPLTITDAIETAPDSAEAYADLVKLIGEPGDLGRAFIKCCMAVKLREAKDLAEAMQAKP